MQDDERQGRNGSSASPLDCDAGHQILAGLQEALRAGTGIESPLASRRIDQVAIRLT